ncbi:putative membrane protein [Wickerhamomyces ciferrii]|uniref:Membrane protein n=1 Tax=Wickerhamomyces ciferrii (strain ATCC 14091 / BCRC 22168 / CBS 111 / JCM 3599 / NBRC 0793 / NRRL Y-1031 F-60-10) TaxID=1206466 RepID=K0K933_WICCF|nr:uncharacterized protein BN7_931 [Wickerhamomyces ciferrii]CCH41390.1 putative membrane protein [Wickerhamomyces ciferrii]
MSKIIYDDKPDDQFIENINTNDNTSTTSQSETSPNDEDFSDINEAKLLRKLDIRLLPIVSFLYLLAYLDRGNIGNAKIEGLPESLNLTPERYNLCLTIFFITYALFEVPSNMLMKKIGRPSIFLGSIMVAWGIVMTMMGVVQGFSGLFVTRLLLGLFEAGLYPTLAYLMSMWYCKGEMQYRQAILHGSASAAGAFSGLLAFAIAKMDGVGGYEGWRWIFILEGLLTVIVAVASFFLMYDFPETANFLTERERSFVIHRLKYDSNKSKTPLKSSRFPPDFGNFTEDDDINLKQALKAALKEWILYVHVLLYYGIITPTYGFALFLPSVVKELGYSSSHAQLMTVPIYITASIISIVVAWFSDKAGLRSPFIAGSLGLVVLGYTLALIGNEIDYPNLVYGGVYVAGIGVYSGFPGLVSWVASSLMNSRKRAIGMALHLGIGNFGGSFSSNFYKPNKYSMGHALEIGFAVMGLLACAFIATYYKYQNKKKQRDLDLGKFDHYSDKQLYQMGNNSPFYKYTL